MIAHTTKMAALGRYRRDLSMDASLGFEGVCYQRGGVIREGVVCEGVCYPRRRVCCLACSVYDRLSLCTGMMVSRSLISRQLRPW